MMNRLCQLFSQSCKVGLKTNVSSIHHLNLTNKSTPILSSARFPRLLDVKSCLPATSLVDLCQKRTSVVIFKKNIAYPRRLPKFQSRPMPNKYVKQFIYPKDGEYTTRTMKVQKLGGRDPLTRRVAINTIGGGVRKNYRWIDRSYLGERGETVQEKVYKVRYDPWNTGLVALVARDGYKRWILASENMKPGDIITTINEIPKNPIYAKEGQMWPVGALTPGTIVHHLEIVPGQGGALARAAGTSCEILRRVGRKIIVKIPTGQDIGIDEWCMCSIGRVSNPNHYTVNTACTERILWKGRRPNKGVKMRKDGYCGRKLRPPKPLRMIDAASLVSLKKEEIQLRSWQFT